MLLDLVPSCDAQVDTTLAHESWNIGRREEDECNWEVLDESNVEAVLAAELDVGALKKVECSGVQPTLCRLMGSAMQLRGRFSGRGNTDS